jgi:hypothetical protein
MAVASEQRQWLTIILRSLILRWLIVLLAAIIGGAIGPLLLWWFG